MPRPSGTVVDEIVKEIVAVFSPRRIVLYGSYGRGDARPDSDVDLMVLFDELKDPEAKGAEIRAHFDGRLPRVDARAYSAAWVALKRNDPGVSIYGIERVGKEVYSRPGAPLPEPKEDGSGVPESLTWWINAAAIDLLGLALEDAVPPDVTCFHAQQASEKYLKALLVQRWVYADRGSDLTPLLAACRAAGYALPDLDADCAALSPYSQDRIKRDGEPEPNILDARAAAAAAGRIVAAAKELLPAERPSI